MKSVASAGETIILHTIQHGVVFDKYYSEQLRSKSLRKCCSSMENIILWQKKVLLCPAKLVLRFDFVSFFPLTSE